MLKVRHGVERHDLPLLIRKLLQAGAQNTSVLHRERSGIRELQTGFCFPQLAQSLEAQEEAGADGEQLDESAISDVARWYVAHTYSGYENKVREGLIKTVENRHLENQIFEVTVPMQDVYELKNGTKKLTQKKLFPGYVLVRMIMNDETWYVVRNTRGVTGFVGPGSKPVPLSEAEMKNLGIRSADTKIDFAEGDSVAVIAGVWKDTLGIVSKLDYTKQIATISVELFGRETPVEISFAELRKTN